MRQAIVTKWLGPTNHKGSRVRASCDAGTLTVSWDHEIGVGDNHRANHRAAALALAEKLGWGTENWIGGEFKGTCVWVNSF